MSKMLCTEVHKHLTHCGAVQMPLRIDREFDVATADNVEF